MIFSIKVMNSFSFEFSLRVVRDFSHRVDKGGNLLFSTLVELTIVASDVSARCSSHPQGDNLLLFSPRVWLEHLAETSEANFH